MRLKKKADENQRCHRFKKFRIFLVFFSLLCLYLKWSFDFSTASPEFPFSNSDVKDSSDWSFRSSLVNLTNVYWAPWVPGHIVVFGKRWCQTCFPTITPMNIDQLALLLAFCISVMTVLSFWLIRPATNTGLVSPDSWINITLHISTWSLLGFSSKKNLRFHSNF